MKVPSAHRKMARAAAVAASSSLLLAMCQVPVMAQAPMQTSPVNVSQADVTNNTIVLSGTYDPLQAKGPVRASTLILKKTRGGRTVTVWSKPYTASSLNGSWSVQMPAPANVAVPGRWNVRVSMQLAGGVVASVDFMAVDPLAPINKPEVSQETYAPSFPTSDPADYSFMALGQNGQPVHWNRCAPVNYFIKPDGLPEGALEVVKEAFRRVSEASGMNFVFAGSTDTIPFTDGTDKVQATQGEGIYVAFTTQQSVPKLSGSTSGYGGFTYSDPGDGSDGRIVNGGVVMDVEGWYMDMGFDYGDSLGPLLEHEILHTLNVGHAKGRGQLMYPLYSRFGPRSVQAGDQSALDGLASRGCS